MNKRIKQKHRTKHLSRKPIWQDTQIERLECSQLDVNIKYSVNRGSDGNTFVKQIIAFSAPQQFLTHKYAFKKYTSQLDCIS